MKQTAVEWLQLEIDNKDMGEIPMWIYQFIEQAKEMEKQQIISGYAFGHNDGCRYMTNEKQEFENGEQYYNQTFKSE